MIPVDSLLYKIDQKLNKLSTNAHQQIQLEDKILALNEAQIKLIKQKVDGLSVASGLGMDSFKKRYEDLQSLILDYNHQPLTLTLEDPNLNQWSANVHLLEPRYMFYVDSYALADKGRCKDRKIWINRDLAKHGDLQFILNNDHYKPSFEYIGLVHNQRELFFKRFQNFHQIMLSPLFYNFKYSKSRILETLKFNIITKNWKTPLIALGGISLSNFKKLKITRVTGIGFKKFIEQV